MAHRVIGLANGIPAAAPPLVIHVAPLAALRRVDGVETDALAEDFNGVAVDDGGAAGRVGQGWKGSQDDEGE